MAAYELRKLCAKDVFPMVNLISKIGINEFAKCFEADSVRDLVDKMASEDEEGTGEDGTVIAGIGVALEIANVICMNLGKAEQEIYKFLSCISNLSVKQVQELDMGSFLQMLVEFVQKEEFKDFFKVVSGLLTKS